jgi:NAD(P)-dependent dehydrogenase (short-subunit alcohol dehydrogenase family)/pimeloyl-ACP methyl ester carboxylesterase
VLYPLSYGGLSTNGKKLSVLAEGPCTPYRVDMIPVRTSSVTGDGVRLAATATGNPDARTILLVHGYPDNSSVWDGLAELLAQRFHVVRYDVRGTGASEAPDSRDGYRLDHLAADLAAVARAVSPHAPVHLVAHDWGSIQAWHAVTDPTLAPLFASYTTISGPCLDHIQRWMRSLALRLHLGTLVNQLLHSTYIALFQVPGLAENIQRLPGALRMLHARPRDARNGLELYRANMLNGKSPEKPQERRTDVPVQQIALLKDAFVTPAILTAADPFCSRLWRRGLPFGHWAPRTHPRQVAEYVTEFVDHVDGEPASRSLRGAVVAGAAGRFGGKLVLITGAGSGIGRAAALAFAAEGADVLATDIDETSAKETARLCRQHDVDAHPYPLDVTDAAAVRALALRVRAEQGVPDIVLANAGIGVAGPFLDTDEADWRRVLDVNLWGVIHTLRAFADLLVERDRGGHLVVTASASAYTPWPALTAYATTKAAVLSLAQSLRTELAPRGIGVSAICPGFVATNITRTTRFVGQDPEAEQRSRELTTRAYERRNFGPERVAPAILDAVEHNRAVVPVTLEGRLAAIGARLSPALMRGLGKLMNTPRSRM